MNVFFQYFWLMCLIVMCINAFFIWQEAKKNIAKDPSLEKGYRNLLKGFLIYGNIPWVIMGIGFIFNLVRDSESFFMPRSFNPIVLIFHAYLLYIWIAGSIWLFFRNGAKILVDYPGFIKVRSAGNKIEITPTLIKFVWIMAMTGGIIAESFMWYLPSHK